MNILQALVLLCLCQNVFGQTFHDAEKHSCVDRSLLSQIVDTDTMLVNPGKEKVIISLNKENKMVREIRIEIVQPANEEQRRTVYYNEAGHPLFETLIVNNELKECHRLNYINNKLTTKESFFTTGDRIKVIYEYDSKGKPSNERTYFRKNK